MTIFRVIIRGSKYPMEYIVQASGWPTAAARGVREWKKRFKGSRVDKLQITIIKSGKLLTENNSESK